MVQGSNRRVPRRNGNIYLNYPRLTRFIFNINCLIFFSQTKLPSGEQLVELFNKKYSEYAVISKKIGVIVGEAQQMMPDLPASDWVTYLEMIDGIILEGKQMKRFQECF